MNKEEIRIINKRLRKGKIINDVYRLFRIFPINQRKIVFTTFEGDGGYCCNPRYIAEEMLNRELDLEMVWLVNDMNKRFPKGIKKVKNTFWNRVYHLSTAKIWIDNTRKPLGTLKRKEQIYLQTWHAGIGFKAVGKYRGKAFPKIAEIISRKDSEQVDYLLSNSSWFTKYAKGMMIYKGKIVKTGSPRCDVLINKKAEKQREIREKYHLEKESKVLLFAPTFRGGNQQGKREIYSEIPTIDFEQLQQALGNKFGGEWYIFLRMHPQLSAVLKEMPLSVKSERMLDVSQEDDMYELMAASDAYITDYSCAAFDALHAGIPVFLYADDLEEYTKERGEFMWKSMTEFPFTLAENNEELMRTIAEFDAEKYREDVGKFQQYHDVVSDGKASKRVVELLRKFGETLYE